jgi:benzoyl-CoA reductase/2-hydroxyglutaryl-CoA dehydratase subunit BcrC/BadD/HgdB
MLLVQYHYVSLKGGSSTSVETASSLTPTMICPLARAQLGERILKRNPYYCHIDMLVDLDDWLERYNEWICMKVALTPSVLFINFPNR